MITCALTKKKKKEEEEEEDNEGKEETAGSIMAKVPLKILVSSHCQVPQ